MSDALILQQPPQGQALQLFLMFHGAGGAPQDMAPLGQRLAQAFSQSAVVSVPAPLEGDGGRGRQWFSRQGVDDANRPARVAQALPLFTAEVRRWQERLGVPPAATALVGFSQGAILALEASVQEPPLAARIIALAGRFATLPERLSDARTLHLIHGKEDEVVPYRHTVEAAEHLIAQGADVTADVLPHTGHALTDAMADLVLSRLQSYIPQARWKEALAAAAAEKSG